MPDVANADMAAAWDGDEGAHWANNADRYESAGRRIAEQLLAAAAIAPDETALDVGCGTGTSTRELARLATDGSAFGVDLSGKMLDVARVRAAADDLTNVRFEQADAQVHPFDADTFDLAISSFGGMFFADPVAAYSNIGRALRPGGRLAMLAWRDMSKNPWILALREALASGRQLPMPPPHVPGPFAFADPDHVRRVLGEAGFADVQLDEINTPLTFGVSAGDAYAFVQTMGIVRGLTQDLDDSARRSALDKLRATLVEHETPEGVQLNTSIWLITAKR